MTDLDQGALAAQLQRQTDLQRELDRARRRAALEARAAYLRGWIEGVKLYAVWENGHQLVGVTRKPLAEVTAWAQTELEMLARQLAQED